ncbi:hypothetical protein B0H11DRAFT_194362 [Mycena galericulata]|nr:hypothetical protein B0H11DRAFT_194362 [Mycena galericulata]
MSEKSTLFSLPNELLEAIVAAGQDEDVSLSEISRPEWTLSRVSRRLRNAITTTPTLWTRVVTHLDRAGSVEISTIYLERSRACKICVALCEVSRDGFEHHIMAEQIGHLVPHIPRIQRLLIESEHSMGEMLSPFQNVAAPVLEHVELRQVSQFYEIPMNVFSLGAPRLTFLKTVSCAPHFPLPQWTVSLTHLELWRYDWHVQAADVFLSITTQLPSLVHLYLDLIDIGGLGRNGFRSTSLEYLHVAFSKDEDSSLLLETFSLFDTPALTHLTIYGSHGDQISELFNPTTIAQFPFPSLTSLTFVYVGCDCEEDPGISGDYRTIRTPPLWLFPALSSLTLINQCFTARILSDIFDPDSQPWPNLQTLTLCFRNHTAETEYNTLQRIVRSKRERQQTLPKFRLPFDLFHKSDWEENGVDVELFDPTELLKELD